MARGAFPSGHAAAEVAYIFGASYELPSAFVPLGTGALLAHWSLVRAGKHFVSDTIVGGTIGLALVAITAKVWPSPSKIEAPSDGRRGRNRPRRMALGTEPTDSVSVPSR